MEILDVKVSGKNILRTLPLFKAALGRIGRAQVYAGDEAPLRSELFSSDQVKRHGEARAHSGKLSLGSVSDRLLTGLAENEDVLFVGNDMYRDVYAGKQAARIPVMKPNSDQPQASESKQGTAADLKSLLLPEIRNWKWEPTHE
jgi:hypothetical protein